jgi:MFS family permease
LLVADPALYTVARPGQGAPMVAVLAPLGVLLVAIAIFALGHGLFGSLVSVRLAVDGHSAGTVGIVSAAYFAGLVVGARGSAAIVRRVGHIRAFAGFAGLLAAIAVTLPLFVGVVQWTLLRALYGACAGGMILVIESWLASAAPDGWRSRLLAAYMVVFYLALGASQFLLNVSSPSGPELFSLVAILLSLCLVPVALTRVRAPTLDVATAQSFAELFALSPLSVIGCFASGILLGAFYGLGPVFGHELGLGTGSTALVMSATILGGLALQWPAGYLSDLFDRRAVIIGVAVTGAVASGAIVALGGNGLAILLGLLVVFGGMAFTLYPLCLAHAADYLRGEGGMVSVSSGLLLAYGLGAIAGPLVAGELFALVHGRGLFVVSGAVFAAVVAYALWRRTRRKAVPNAEQVPFVAVPRTTTAAYELDPRSESPEG